MRDRLRRLLTPVLDLVYPPACLLCSVAMPAYATPFHFCDDCHAALTHDPHLTCPRCSSTVGPGVDASQGCPRCRGVTLTFNSSTRLGPYDGKLRDAILAMKHASGQTLAESLGRLWGATQRETLLQSNPQVVVPVPLHWGRRISRGYNQSAVLARSLASELELPCRARTLRKIRATPEQTTLSATARRETVRGVFRLSRSADVRGLRVLLVDDVLTTGATADAAARALFAGDAAQVTVAVLAHR